MVIWMKRQKKQLCSTEMRKKLKQAEDNIYLDSTFFNSLNDTLKQYKMDRQNDLQFQMATSFLLHNIEQ